MYAQDGEAGLANFVSAALMLVGFGLGVSDGLSKCAAELHRHVLSTQIFT